MDRYVTLMLQLVQGYPWISAPEILGHLASAGPLRNGEQIAELFRGVLIFHGAVARMAPVRFAVLYGELNGLPITTRVPEDEWIGNAAPSSDGHNGRWPPQVAREGPAFPIRMIRSEGGAVQRYPHEGEYADDYMRSEDSESSMED